MPTTPVTSYPELRFLYKCKCNMDGSIGEIGRTTFRRHRHNPTSSKKDFLFFLFLQILLTRLVISTSGKYFAIFSL